jgi:hypothetical protein
MRVAGVLLGCCDVAFGLKVLLIDMLLTPFCVRRVKSWLNGRVLALVVLVIALLVAGMQSTGVEGATSASPFWALFLQWGSNKL